MKILARTLGFIMFLIPVCGLFYVLSHLMTLKEALAFLGIGIAGILWLMLATALLTVQIGSSSEQELIGKYLAIQEELQDIKEELNKSTQCKERARKSPTKQSQVKNWRNKHPQGSKSECARMTGISPKTVSKYWN